MPLWQAFSRDRGYQLSGPLPILSVKGVRRWLGIDAVELTTPFSLDAYSRLAPGCGVVVQRGSSQQVSGMVGSRRSLGFDFRAGRATITVAVLGDMQHLADRLVWPNPTSPVPAQTSNYWTYTGLASTALWSLIRAQAGVGTLTFRRVPTLVMGSDPGVGVSRLWSEQFASVLDTLTAWSQVSGADLGVRITTTPDGLRADVLSPPDVSAAVRFSAGLRNVTGWEYEQTPPSVTYAIAAGQGNLAARVRVASSSASAADTLWGRRIERYIDQRDEADPTKLQQAADDEIAQGIGSVLLTTDVADTPVAVYGKDWDLGSRVTVHVGLPNGSTVATLVDLVREVAFEVDSKGREKITTAIGTSDASAIRMTDTQSGLTAARRTIRRLVRNQ